MPASPVPPREVYIFSKLRRSGGDLADARPPPRAGEPRGELRQQVQKIYKPMPRWLLEAVTSARPPGQEERLGSALFYLVLP